MGQGLVWSLISKQKEEGDRLLYKLAADRVLLQERRKLCQQGETVYGT